MSVVPFSEEDLHELYLWVDDIPISRPKRNIARDFADGCCVAEILKFFFPKLVDLHNYVPAGSIGKKKENWHLLNHKVFSKLYFVVPEEEVEDIVNAVPGAIERFLRALRIKITQIKGKREELGDFAMHYPRHPHRGDGKEEYDEDADLEYFNAALKQHQQDGARQSAPPVRPTTGSKKSATTTNHTTTTTTTYNRPSAGAAAARSSGSTQPYTKVPHDDAQRDVLGVKELINEKDKTILELRETVNILTEKIMKLEELVQVKDEKLNQYRNKFGRV